MAPYATVDRSAFPLVVVTFTGAAATPENFQAYLEDLEKNYKPRAPFALVFDASQASIPGLHYQKKQAAWMKSHEELIRAYCRGVAYVLSNALLRPVLSLIFKLQAQPVPFRVWPDRAAGIAWAESRLEEKA